jgi:hypothetical protein
MELKMLPEWLKSIFRGTRKEVKETVNENVDAVAQKAAALTKAAIAKEAEIIKKAIPMANSIVDSAEHAADNIVDKAATKAVKNVKKATGGTQQ